MMKDMLTAPCSILIVEDDPATREITASVIRNRFVEATVLLAENGQVGLDLYRQHAPQIVVTDIKLPGLDGIRMVSEILALNPATHIIVVSAYSEPSCLLDAIKLGIHRYLLKPVDLKLLIESIADCLARVEMEVRLRAQELHIRKLSQIVEQNPCAVVLTDAAGVIEYVNDKFFELTGYCSAEILGQNPRVLKTELTSADTHSDLWQKITRGEVWRGEFVNRKKSGEHYWESASISPLIDDSGTITHFIAIKEDITKYKQFEQQLQESEKRYRSLFDNMLNGLAFCRMVFDEEGTPVDFVYLAVNDAFGRLIGVTDVAGKRATELFPGIRDSHPELFRIYGRVSLTGEPESFEFEFLHTGTRLAISVYSTQTGHFTAVFNDITERARTEAVLKQSEEKFRTLFELSPDGIELIDMDGTIRMCNRQNAELHGYGSPEEMIGKNVFELIAPGSRQAVSDTMAHLVRTGESRNRTEEFAILKQDGSVFPAEVSGALVRNDEGDPSAIIGIRDITERRESEDEVRQGRERLSQIVDGVSVPIFVIDATHTVTHWNRACASLTGVPAAEVVGTRNQWQVFYPEQRPVMADLMVDGADEATFLRVYGEKLRHSEVIKGVFESENFFPHFGEGGKWLYCTAALWLDPNGKVLGAIETLQDVTERKQAEEALKESQRRYYELSITDNLTGLFNSRHFFSQLQLERERANRYSRPLSLLLLDVDNFKGYNDTYGHVEGDRVLAGLAAVIRSSIRESDSGYRYGGEEFVAILPETGRDEALAVAERLRQTFERTPFYPMGHGEVHMTISIGVSCYRPSDELKEFIRRADQGTYAAKRQGKNRVVYLSGAEE
jgi:diguanylate cyclase (GGDEF)-like protein/PAS domain S-box-containing protein